MVGAVTYAPGEARLIAKFWKLDRGVVAVQVVEMDERLREAGAWPEADGLVIILYSSGATFSVASPDDAARAAWIAEATAAIRAWVDEHLPVEGDRAGAWTKEPPQTEGNYRLLSPGWREYVAFYDAGTRKWHGAFGGGVDLGGSLAARGFLFDPTPISFPLPPSESPPSDGDVVVVEC